MFKIYVIYLLISNFVFISNHIFQDWKIFYGILPFKLFFEVDGTLSKIGEQALCHTPFSTV